MSFLLPPWAGPLCNLYWMLRYFGSRDSARRRSLYRQIAVEKKRLLAAGVDGEELRLFCRHLANPRNRHAEAKWSGYVRQRRLPL